MVCPSETTEGQACGMVKKLSLMTYVSVGSSANFIIELLDEWRVLVLVLASKENGDASKVFVNGVWVEIHNDIDFLVNALIQLRRSGEICKEVSIVRDIRER